MNQFNVIIALIFSLVITIFALYNSQPIIINYLYGKTEVPAAIVILGAAILGALVIFLLNVFKQIKTGFRLRSLQSELNQFSSQVDELKNERDDLLIQLRHLQNDTVTPEVAVNVASEPASVTEPYVTGYYMDQQGSEDKENNTAANEDEQTNSTSEITSEPADKGLADQEPGIMDSKDEKEL